MQTNDELWVEIQKIRPPLTYAQGMARRRAEAEIDEKYPGQVVAFVDTWTGDSLDRKVLAVAADRDGLETQLDRLDPEVRDRVEVTEVLGPDDDVSIGGADLWFR